jgi:hypothetical protein
MTYPVMFADAETIGEGKVTDLSVFGCSIECTGVIPETTTLAVRLLLPDQEESLPIEQAEVRWVNGNRVGIQFEKVDRASNLRLHLFVWDRMLERLQRIKQEGSSLS